jgi:6-phosphogluconolactonase
LVFSLGYDKTLFGVTRYRTEPLVFSESAPMVFARFLSFRRWFLASLSLAAGAGWCAGPAIAAEPSKYWVFVGTYTDSQSKGIYRMMLDTATGKLSEPTLAAAMPSPSFLAVHPTHKYLYAVSETSGRDGAGSVTAFALDSKSGDLTRLNQQSTVGDGPCYLVVDGTGKNVLVANYGGGSVAVLPIGADGRLGRASDFIRHTGRVFDRKRQGGPHAHSINLDKNNRFALAADLGLDRIFVYKFDPIQGKLAPNDPPSAKVKDRSGPRHFAFHPDGKHAYVINEINCTVTAFDFDPGRGTLTEIQTIPTMPVSVEPQHSTAEVVVHPTGKFLYGSNRGHDSVAVYAIEPETGRLKIVEYKPTGGKTPRNFAVDPTGSYLLAENMGSDTIVVFRINRETGALDPTGQVVDVPNPCCVKFVPVAE